MFVLSAVGLTLGLFRSATFRIVSGFCRLSLPLGGLENDVALSCVDSSTAAEDDQVKQCYIMIAHEKKFLRNSQQQSPSDFCHITATS